MPRRPWPALVLTAALSAGCSEGDLLTAPTPSARVDGTWSLVSATNSAISLTEAKASSRFVLTLAGDRALLKADCNTCAGDFRRRRHHHTQPQACTRAFCQSSPLDTQVTQAVDGSHTVRLDATRLQFSSSRGEIKFER
jgi:heat shock protein HslJ